MTKPAVKMTKPAVQNKAATVASVASKNVVPPLCQTLKALCNQGLMQTSATTAALGTMQIMVGLFNIGLGPGRTSTHPGGLTDLGAAYWLGAVFIVSGIMSILAGQFRSSCLVGFTVFMNIAGAIFAITAFVLYTIDLSDSSLLWMCDNGNTYRDDQCRRVASFAQRLLTSMDTTLIALAVLQIYANIRVAILGINALCSDKEEDGEAVEDQQTGLKDVLLTIPVA